MRFRTIKEAREAVVQRLDAPPQLRFWLEHMPPESPWLEAPRPDWLSYLARVSGAGPELLRHLCEVAEAACETPRRRSSKIDYDPTATFAPLLDGAERIRGMLSRLR